MAVTPRRYVVFTQPAASVDGDEKAGLRPLEAWLNEYAEVGYELAGLAVGEDIIAVMRASGDVVTSGGNVTALNR